MIARYRHTDTGQTAVGLRCVEETSFYLEI